MDNPLFVNERKSIRDLFRPSTYVSDDSRISGFCWSCFRVTRKVTLQVSSAVFHYQDHSCGSFFLEKGCAIKLYNVRMLQFSEKQNKNHAIYINSRRYKTGGIQTFRFSVIFISFILMPLMVCVPHRPAAEEK